MPAPSVRVPAVTRRVSVVTRRAWQDPYCALANTEPVAGAQRLPKPGACNGSYLSLGGTNRSSPPPQPRRQQRRQPGAARAGVRPDELERTHPRVRHQAHRQGQEQEGDTAVPEAVRCPRGLPDLEGSGHPTFFLFGASTYIGVSVKTRNIRCRPPGFCAKPLVILQALVLADSLGLCSILPAG